MSVETKFRVKETQNNELFINSKLDEKEVSVRCYCRGYRNTSQLMLPCLLFIWLCAKINLFEVLQFRFHVAFKRLYVPID